MTYPWFGSLVVNLAGWFLAGWFWRTSVVQRRRADAATAVAAAHATRSELLFRKGESKSIDDLCDRIREETRKRILELCAEIEKEPQR